MLTKPTIRLNRRYWQGQAVCVTFVTESGRSEILLSFHTVGHDYRGVIGASMCFYRRQRADGEGIEQQVIELQTVSEDLFQVNYKEDVEAAERHFGPWLEKALVRGDRPTRTVTAARRG